ncbi:MAG: hypothetical protein QXT09_07675, partial [Candidatus Nitrosocaldus sp.]
REEGERERVTIDLADKSDKELLLMVKEEIEKIKEIIEGLKTPLAATLTTTPTASTTAATTAVDLPSLAS